MAASERLFINVEGRPYDLTDGAYADVDALTKAVGDAIAAKSVLKIALADGEQQTLLLKPSNAVDIVVGVVPNPTGRPGVNLTTIGRSPATAPRDADAVHP